MALKDTWLSKAIDTVNILPDNFGTNWLSDFAGYYEGSPWEHAWHPEDYERGNAVNMEIAQENEAAVTKYNKLFEESQKQDKLQKEQIDMLHKAMLNQENILSEEQQFYQNQAEQMQLDFEQMMRAQQGPKSNPLANILKGAGSALGGEQSMPNLQNILLGGQIGPVGNTPDLWGQILRNIPK